MGRARHDQMTKPERPRVLVLGRVVVRGSIGGGDGEARDVLFGNKFAAGLSLGQLCAHYVCLRDGGLALI